MLESHSRSAPEAKHLDLPSAALAKQAASIAITHLDEAALERTSMALLDTLAVMVAGVHHSSSASLIASALADVTEPLEGSVVLATGRRSSATVAAMSNGAAAHSLDLDDSHRSATGYHPGATVIPAVLAAGEANNAPAADVLAATVAGYEVGGRVGRAINPSHRYRGFHSTGTIGALGAAAGAARVMGLDAHTTHMAVGIAASMAGGTFVFLQGNHPTKHLHAGHAAASGVLAARLASQGLTAPANALEGPEGFFEVYADETRIETLTEEGPPEIMRNYFKPYAACGQAFSAIEAAMDLRSRGIDMSALRQIVVTTYRAAAVLDRSAADTIQQAQFSIPILVATSLMRGDVSLATVAEGLHDPAITSLASLVTVREERAFTTDFPKTRTAVLEVRLDTGESLAARVDLPRNMTGAGLSMDEVKRKAIGLLTTELEAEEANAAINAICRGDLGARQLMALVCPRKRGPKFGSPGKGG